MRLQLVLVTIIFSLHFQCTFAQNTISQNKANRLFNSGRVLIQHSELGGAKDQFQDFLRIAPRTDIRIPEADYYAAFSALKLYHANSEKRARDFVAKNPTDPWSTLAYYDMAHFFYEQQKYDTALSYFEKIDFSILDEEQYVEGRFHWGYTCFNLRKLDDALEQFNFIKFLDSRFSPAANYYSGFIALKNGALDSALTDLKVAEKSKSYASIVPYMIASVYYRQNKYDELLEYINGLTEQDLFNEDEMALLLAEVDFKKNNYGNALKGYQRYLDSKNTSTKKNILLKAGFSAYSIGQDETAMGYLKKSAIDDDSVGFYSSYYLGSLYLKKGMKPLALNAFEHALKYDNAPAMAEESNYQRAKILYDMGRYGAAAEALQKIIDKYPSSPHLGEVKKLLSQVYVDVANYDKAITYIEALPTRTMDINKIYQKATWLKGVELFNKENYAQAAFFFEKSLQYPMDKSCTAETSFWNGETYSIGKKYDQAINNYLRTISLSSHSGTALLNKTRYALGYTFFTLKRYERALYNFKEFVRLAEKSANYPDAILRLADCYYVTKVYNKALSNYRQYMQIDSADTDYALLQTGVILGIQQQYNKAIASLNQVIQEYPQSQFMDEAMFQKAQLDFEQGNYVVAVSGFTILIKSHPASLFLPYAYMRRAASYYNLKKYTETVADYVTVLQKYTSHPVSKNALLPLQEALSLAGRAKEFDGHLARYKRASPDTEGIESIEFETAQHLYFNQDYQEAIQSFENYITAYPQSARLTEARYYQAESHYRLNNYPKSLETHKEVLTDLTFSLINRSVARVAELEYNGKNYREAVLNFSKLANMAVTKKEKIKAWSGMMESYFMLKKYDSSDFYAKHIMEKGEANIGVKSNASLFLGKSAMAQGDYETAKDEFINTINIAKDEYGAEAKYLLGKVFFITKDHKQCYQTLIGLNTDFAPYTEWVGRAFLLLSDNFVAVGDIFQAKGTLNSLVDRFPLEHIKLEARKKLNEINKKERMEEGLPQQDSLSNQIQDSTANQTNDPK